MSLITRQQAGEILNRSERTIDDWVQNGVLKAHQVKNMRYIDSDTVYALKDTEADIDHALKIRDNIRKEIEREIKEFREAEGLDLPFVRYMLWEIVKIMGNDVLTDRERAIAERILDGDKLKDVGEEFGITRERVRQIFGKAARKISERATTYDELNEENNVLRGRITALQSKVRHLEDNLHQLEELKNVVPDTTTEEDMILYNTPITDTMLSVRAINCLKAIDIDTIGDLLKHHKSDLIRCRNMGRKTLLEISDYVEDVLGKELGELANKYKRA